MSDYISKSELVENIKAEIQCVEKEKQQYFESGNFHNGNILVEKIQAMKLVMKIVANQPTLSETEIIRKYGEKIVKRLNGIRKIREAFTVGYCQYTLSKAIEIVKEECGINE